MIFSTTYEKNLFSASEVIPNLEDLRNRKILVTGAGGLICSVIIDLFAFLNCNYNYNIDIYAADLNIERCKKRFNFLLEMQHFHLINHNVVDKLNLDIEFDYIIHGASPANPKMYVSSPVETMQANIIGTNNLLEYSKNYNVKRFLYISSSEVYGNKETNEKYYETDYNYLDILNPRACYPSSKRAAETLCVSYYDEYGVECVIVRPGHVYGPSMTSGDNRAASQFARDVLNNQDIIMKSLGNQLRSHCYVDDCVSAILTVLINGECGEAYNISNPNAISTIREIAEAFAIAGNKKVIFELPDAQEKKGYNLMTNSSLSSKKLENLGWHGIYNLQSGTKMTLQMLKEFEKNKCL